ncbi:hypothetical protein Goarm_017215, partial [Gossypium armourianum]|nr:hypothetical protein [Gossypium armourianum]
MGGGAIMNGYVSDSFSAEALACLQAIKFAAKMDFRQIEVKGDSRTTIAKIKQGKQTHQKWVFLANMVAHLIAQERFKISNDRFWVEDVPEVAIVVVN